MVVGAAVVAMITSVVYPGWGHMWRVPHQSRQWRLVGIGCQVGHLLGESGESLCKCGKYLLGRLVVGILGNL